MKKALLGTLALLGTIGCGQPPGEMTSGGYTDLPPDVQGKLTEENVDFVLEKGTDVHVGSSPPDISGTYLLDAFTVANSSYSTENSEFGYRLRFFTNPDTSSLSFEMAELDPGPIVETYRSDSVTVVGEGKNFTAFVGLAPRSELDLPQLHVFSGTVDAEGIHDLTQFFCDYSDKYGFEGDLDLVESDGRKIGGFRVSEETDGLAARVTE